MSQWIRLFTPNMAEVMEKVQPKIAPTIIIISSKTLFTMDLGQMANWPPKSHLHTRLMQVSIVFDNNARPKQISENFKHHY